MTWDMFLKGVSAGLGAMILAGVFVGFNKYLCIIICVFIVACAAFGITGLVTHSIGAMPAEAIAVP